MKSKFCIVIPIYKKELDCTEELSLNRLYKLVKDKHYDMFFIKPNSLNCENYYKIINKEDIKELAFDDKFFEGIKMYSQLCINYDFYNRLSDYEYMYLYQLDCYLLEDKLEYWCEQDYDYIGAPIISTESGWDVLDKKTNKWEPKVGNGGFSLRKILIFKELTDPNGEFRKYYKLTDEITSQVIYEDKYFCNDLYKLYDLNIPDWKIASEFSWDMNADIYKKFFNIEYLPMCAHAWTRNIRYWQEILEELKDNKEVIDFCENKYKEFFNIYYNENNESIKKK